MNIPAEFIETGQLYNMKVGETGYVVPWCMWVHTSGQAYLNEAYTISSTKGGTVQLKVTRVIDGYIVHLDTFNYGGEKYKWEQQDSPGFMTPQERCYGKVVAFSNKEYNMIQQDPIVIQRLINDCIINEEYEKAAEYQNILRQL